MKLRNVSTQIYTINKNGEEQLGYETIITEQITEHLIEIEK